MSDTTHILSKRLRNVNRTWTAFWLCLLCLLCLLLAGCFAPTPAERITQLNGKIVSRGNGVIDLDLSGTKATDEDMAYIHALCSNSGGRWKSMHTLDLSNTAITDRALEMMAMQDGFTSPMGLHVLILTNTNTSDTAIQKFQDKAPDCEIKK